MADEATTQWRSALEILAGSAELGQGKLSIIRTTHAVDVDGTLVLIVGSTFARNVVDNARGHIAQALRRVSGYDVPFEVIVDTSLESSAPVLANRADTPAVRLTTRPVVDQIPEAPVPAVSAPVPPAAPADDAPAVPGGYATAEPSPAVTVPDEGSDLNPKYTFDTYVTGSSNRLPHASAIAVAEAPAKAYNPLFIYGGSGLGKTHLLHAIGHYARRLYPSIRVKYVSSEEFVSDFIASVADGRMDAFKRRYREVDILLVDDIQFLQGKEQTLEEFFHTFNALHTANKQVVLTSDQPPKALGGFEERLRSRFEWGLLADVQPPDFETRTAILSRKASAEGLDLPADVLEYIASRVTTNIRELEGALIRVTAFASLTKQPVDRTLAELVLKDIITDPASEEITSALIMAQTADYFGITIDDLCSSNRARTFVHARHIGMYLCRELTDMSLPQIGREFGGRDHTTVMSADKKIRTQMPERRETYNHVAELTARIKQAAQSATAS
ncbi:chromosomal replication initiator protein DnaA [Actinomyces sp. 432]|uniref:chromosomal replication initiator protein DnaA n=1 Tax=Actinomyces sp. 432 TaxID=2057798 RepID=UPI0013745D86|nr:chromosomal replication initiator protein DnaA [Actinomyces sp. 432]QHO90044.1 chromosomal replication initiator protein DnaA [Actinomyces sp. 432]QHO92091.1 chromosomal replication initiator protein DnaA [Actinomyces sp. 432]